MKWKRGRGKERRQGDILETRTLCLPHLLSTCPLLHTFFSLCSLFKYTPTCSLSPSPHPSWHFSPISSPFSLVRGSGHTPSSNNSWWLYSHAPPRNLCPQVWNSITQPQTGGQTQIHFIGWQQRHQILSEISPPALRVERKGRHDWVAKERCRGFSLKNKPSFFWGKRMILYPQFARQFHWLLFPRERRGQSAISLIEWGGDFMWLTAIAFISALQCIVYEYGVAQQTSMSSNTGLSVHPWAN